MNTQPYGTLPSRTVHRITEMCYVPPVGINDSNKDVHDDNRPTPSPAPTTTPMQPTEVKTISPETVISESEQNNRTTRPATHPSNTIHRTTEICYVPPVGPNDVNNTNNAGQKPATPETPAKPIYVPYLDDTKPAKPSLRTQLTRFANRMTYFFKNLFNKIRESLKSLIGR